MQMEPTARVKSFQVATVVIIAVILVAPIIVYISTFGFTISDSHSRWGEMGSAISGIYSPLIAFLALLVVNGQLKSQNTMNAHMFDQSYIQDARSDIHGQMVSGLQSCKLGN